jgi:hypothetical protein
MKLKDFAG